MIHVRILRNIFSGDWENAYIEGPASAREIKAAIGNMDSPIYFNGCLLDDNDIVPDNSFLILKIIPQGVATGLFVASLVTIIAFGVSAIFIINALSSIPSAKKLQSSPSLRGSTNSARKGQMLPILLGKYRVYPDVAALPYSIYNNDKQSLVQLFCFGYSNVSIDTDTLKIGETPLSKYKEAYYSTSPSEYSMRCIETNIGLCLQNDGSSSPIERRTASNTWKIAVGIIAPSGIHEYDGDSKKSATISIRISYKESSSQSWIIAHDRTLSLNKDTYRESFEIIPPYTGTYDVKVERTNKESESSSVIDTIYLDVLQSWTEDDNGSKAPIINKTAFRLLELKLQATDQLNGIVDELNAICTLKTWDYIGTGTGKSAWILRETQNPASMILYLLTNQMANPSPLSEDQIAWDEFEAFYLYCKEKGFECNAYINSEDYSISDLCNYIAQSNLAQIRKAGLKTGIIIDQESDHIVQMFTPRNAWGFSMKKAMTINDQYLRIKYVDASIGYVETERSIMLSEDGSTVIDIKDTTEFDGREISLVGVTSPDHAAIVGRQRLLELAHRKRTFSWNCDLEGILCTPGDVILFEHNQFSIGLGEARIKEAITAGEYTIALILDEILPFEQGKTYGFTIRKNYTISESVEIAKTAGNRIDLKIPSSLAFDNGDLIAIGELSKETIKLMVTSIERDSSENCTITATDYAEVIYSDGIIPPYDPGISIYPEGGDVGIGAKLPDNFQWPKPIPGANASFLDIDISSNSVTYYADGIIKDDDNITITASSDSEISLYINGIQKTTGYETLSYNFKPSSLLSNVDTISVKVESGSLRKTATIKKLYLTGTLKLTANKSLIGFYADNIPHSEESIILSINCSGYYAKPKLYIDNVEVEYDDDGTFLIESTILLDKNYITARTLINGYEEDSITISKVIDQGILELSSSKTYFEYYADDEPHNASDFIALTIGQSGFSAMPDLYVNGTKKEYAGTEYIIRPSDMSGHRINIMIEKAGYAKDMYISKVLDTPMLTFQLSSLIAEFYYDNVPISDDIDVKVHYSGLFYAPVLKANDTQITLDSSGNGLIPMSLLQESEDGIQVEVSASRNIDMAFSQTIKKITKPLVLSLGLDCGQFTFDSAGNPSPSSIAITNNTQGLSDKNLVSLVVGGNSQAFSEEGTFILTPDMIDGRFIILTIAYKDQTSSAIVTKTYDGKGEIIEYSKSKSFTIYPDEDYDFTYNEDDFIYNGIAMAWLVPWSCKMPDIYAGEYLWKRSRRDESYEWRYARITGLQGADGKDGGGEYIGHYTSPPSEKPNGSSLAENDFYLDVSTPGEPLPYKWNGSTWLLVTADDPAWSQIASATQNDVSLYGGMLLSTSAYYGYFQALSAQKALIKELGTQNIVISNGGSIESENYATSDGIEGFHIDSNGDIVANSGTWRGSFANGLTFVPPTKILIDKNMSQKEAYAKMIKAGIREGEYICQNARDLSKNCTNILEDKPIPFCCYDYDPEKVAGNLAFPIIGSYDTKKLLKSILTNESQSVEVPVSIFGYPTAAIIPIAFDKWLLYQCTYGTQDNNNNTFDTIELDGFYLITKKDIEEILNRKFPVESIADESVVTDYLKTFPKRQDAMDPIFVQTDYTTISSRYTVTLFMDVISEGDNFHIIGMDADGSTHIFSWDNESHAIKECDALSVVGRDDSTSFVFSRWIAPAFYHHRYLDEANVPYYVFPTIHLLAGQWSTTDVEIALLKTYNFKEFYMDSIIPLENYPYTFMEGGTIMDCIKGSDNRFYAINYDMSHGNTSSSFICYDPDTENWIKIPDQYYEFVSSNYDSANPKNVEFFSSFTGLCDYEGKIIGSLTGGTLFSYDPASGKFKDLTHILDNLIPTIVSNYGNLGFYEFSLKRAYRPCSKEMLEGTGIFEYKALSNVIIRSISYDRKEQAIFCAASIIGSPVNGFVFDINFYLHPEDETISIFSPVTVSSWIDYGNSDFYLFKFMSNLITNESKRTFANAKMIYVSGYGFDANPFDVWNPKAKEMISRLKQVYVKDESVISILKSMLLEDEIPFPYLLMIEHSRMMYSVSYFMGVISSSDTFYQTVGRSIDPDARLYRHIDSDKFTVASAYPILSCYRILIREESDYIDIVLNSDGSSLVKCIQNTVGSFGFGSLYPIDGLEGYNMGLRFDKTNDMQSFIRIYKNSNDPVGASFLWNFPAQLSTREGVGNIETSSIRVNDLSMIDTTSENSN